MSKALYFGKMEEPTVDPVPTQTGNAGTQVVSTEATNVQLVERQPFPSSNSVPALFDGLAQSTSARGDRVALLFGARLLDEAGRSAASDRESLAAKDDEIRSLRDQLTRLSVEHSRTAQSLRDERAGRKSRGVMWLLGGLALTKAVELFIAQSWGWGIVCVALGAAAIYAGAKSGAADEL